MVKNCLKREIEELANAGHAEAIIAFGNDLYIQGVALGFIGASIGFVTAYIVSLIKREFIDTRIKDSV